MFRSGDRTSCDSQREPTRNYLNTAAGRGVSLCTIAVPIAMIVIGAVNRNNCPVQDKIPIWLMAGGAVALLSTIVVIAENYMRSVQSLKDHILDALISVAMFVWLIFGSVWVYSASPKVVYLPGTDDYCDKTTFIFTFVVITFTYSILVLSIFCGIGLAICKKRRQ